MLFAFHEETDKILHFVRVNGIYVLDVQVVPYKQFEKLRKERMKAAELAPLIGQINGLAKRGEERPNY